MVVKAVLHNQPKGIIEDIEVDLKEINSEKMYERVLEQKVEYHQFIEWVQHDIGMQIYKDFDTLFKEAE